MIPISPDKRLKWLDENSGVTYYFRYLTGENQVAYNELVRESLRGSDEFIDKAKRTVNARVKKGGKKPVQDKLNDMVIKEAEKLAQEYHIENPEESFRYSRFLIDLFLVGWEGKGIDSFPTDGKPSRYFTAVDLSRMANVITERLSELAGLSLDKAKN